MRTPLSGRGFECFSEDPLLTARLAVAYVRGVQQAGVGATAKHYVANDSETDRRTYDARISEQVLRELYLPPFEACVFEADVALVMAAYNSVNGHTMTANPTLLRDLLKDEWGFQGVVVSDWSATRTTGPDRARRPGPGDAGPRGPWGDQLVAAVRAGTVPEAVIDDKVSRLLRLARRVGAINGALERESPDGADGHHASSWHRFQRSSIQSLLREVTSRSFVLLRNQDGLLPLRAQRRASCSTDRPNAAEPQTQGGGSVRVLPVVRPGLADSLRALGEFDAVDVHQGCLTWATIPPPRDGNLRDPVSGNPVCVSKSVTRAEPAPRRLDPSSVLTWWDGLPDGASARVGAGDACDAIGRGATDRTLSVSPASGCSASPSTDRCSRRRRPCTPPRSSRRSRAARAARAHRAARGGEVEICATYRPNVRVPNRLCHHAARGTPRLDEDRLLDEAVAAATEADVAVVVVGSAEGTESEGYDRETLSLPGGRTSWSGA